jgi:hypothetical protein
MTQAPRRPPACRAALAAVLLAGAGWAGWAAAQNPASPSVSSTPVAPKPAPPRVAQPVRVESAPTWAELTAPQKQALAPLTTSWGRLSAAHKQKWLAVSQNFPTMPPPEQARLHSRMAEWAALSPQQRNQARMNFAEAQALPADDKKAKWEAYQALSPEEKRKLGAAAAKPVPPPTAAAVQPVPKQKLATAPRPKRSASGPRIAGNQIDQNTLLPQPGSKPPSPP